MQFLILYNTQGSRSCNRDDCNEQNNDDIDMDESTEEPFSATNILHYAYIAERAPKGTTTVRKQVLDGVYVLLPRQKPDDKPVGSNRQGKPSSNEVVLTQGDQNDQISPPQLDQRGYELVDRSTVPVNPMWTGQSDQQRSKNNKDSPGNPVGEPAQQ